MHLNIRKEGICEKIVTLVLVGIFLVIVTRCSTTKSFTYDVTTGDSIKVELNTSGGYNITSTLPFTISKDDKTLSQGTFVTIDSYNQYLNAINGDAKAKILDSGDKSGIIYTFYSYNDSEFNYIIKINGSKTGLLLSNLNSQAEAQECFDRLTFSKAE